MKSDANSQPSKSIPKPITKQGTKYTNSVDKNTARLTPDNPKGR